MEIYQLKYFVAIADSGSFTRAADQLYVSQPSLSASIKKLEHELGVSLLERRWRDIALTTAGDLFLEKAQNLIADYQAAIDTLRNFQVRPVLRVGMLCTLQVQTIVTIIQFFRELYPDIIIELCDTHLDELTTWLDHGEIDIAVTALTADTKTSQILFRQRLVLGVPHQHPFAQKQEIHLQDLKDQPFIERVKCEILTKQSLSIFEAAGIHPHVVYRSDHED
ncbi:MAG: LysR family transcriptional regulator [Leptolyngbyaceae cyanobacterium MAG.088]|nr:LysR family transcriptional regulator [Leptolyngbyaceae cyanobacterium MAG.088]